MNHPYIANLNGQAKFNQMLNEAEACRRAKRIAGERPSFFKALFSRDGKITKPQSEKVAGTISKIRPAA